MAPGVVRGTAQPSPRPIRTPVRGTIQVSNRRPWGAPDHPGGLHPSESVPGTVVGRSERARKLSVEQLVVVSASAKPVAVVVASVLFGFPRAGSIAGGSFHSRSG